MIEFKTTRQLEHSSFTFSQPPNTIGTKEGGDYETITIETHFQLDEEEGPFFTLKTSEWSFDSIQDLRVLFERVLRSIECKQEVKESILK